jgi:antitoxin PrlF
MFVIGKITSKGQTTVPAEVRAALGIGPGDSVEYVFGDDGQITLRKPRHGLESLRGMIKPGIAVTSGDIDRWCSDVRENGWRRE